MINTKQLKAYFRAMQDFNITELSIEGIVIKRSAVKIAPEMQARPAKTTFDLDKYEQDLEREMISKEEKLANKIENDPNYEAFNRGVITFGN